MPCFHRQIIRLVFPAPAARISAGNWGKSISSEARPTFACSILARVLAHMCSQTRVIVLLKAAGFRARQSFAA